jgi:hypothetical protein
VDPLSTGACRELAVPYRGVVETPPRHNHRGSCRPPRTHHHVMEAELAIGLREAGYAVWQA